MKTRLIQRKVRQFAVVPLKDFKQLVQDAQMLSDIRAFDAAKARNEESFPSEVVQQLLAGAYPIRVFRQHRGLTQAKLAKTAKIARPYLAQLETGRRQGSVNVLGRIAQILEVELTDITD